MGRHSSNNYIFIFDLTSGFNGLGKDDCEAMNNRHDDPTIYMTDNTVKCRYNAVLGVQEIDRVIAVTAL